jgi:hypothetical protein
MDEDRAPDGITFIELEGPKVVVPLRFLASSGLSSWVGSGVSCASTTTVSCANRCPTGCWPFLIGAWLGGRSIDARSVLA